MSDDLFIEVFPIAPESLPLLYAYQVTFRDPSHLSYGGKLAFRLSRTFPGTWIWYSERLITDALVSTVQMDIALDILRNQVPELYGKLESIEEDPRWQMTPPAAAEWVLGGPVRECEPELRQKLSSMSMIIKNAVVERDMRIEGWEVAGEPALSLSTRSMLRHPRLMSDYLSEGHTPHDVIGRRVVDMTSSSMVATVTRYAGTVADHREHLMSLTRRELMQNLIRQAPDDEAVFGLQLGDYTYEYIASALYPIISPTSTDLQRFGVSSEQAHAAMRIRPDQRAQMIRALSDVLKQAEIIGSAFSTRTHPHLFARTEMTPNLRYAERRVLPYRPEAIPNDLLKAGIYRRYSRYDKAAMRVLVINTGEEAVTDFIEVLRRQLDKTFGLRLEILKERPLRDLSPDSLKLLGRALDKDKADCVLVFGMDDGEDNADLALLHAIIAGRSLPMYAISSATVQEPDAMPRVIMSLLARTGHVPFVLAEPLEYADYVTGLTFTRESLKKKDRVTALHRIYQSDGTLVGYRIETCDVGSGAPCPLSMFEALFPRDVFANKRVLVHHEGPFAKDVLYALGEWSASLGMELTPTEVTTDHTPRLYRLGAKVEQAPWGSLFKLTDDEAFVVASVPSPTAAVQPLHVRVRADFAVEAAVYSVLAWTLLHYGAPTYKRPVTLHNADQWSSWVTLGKLISAQGDVPFWL